MQEGALTMAFGGRWNLWGFGGSSAVQFEFTQMASQFHAFREAALGPSVSLAHIAVLDSETTWAARGALLTPATRAAKALGEAGYFTDLVNEKTLRQNLTPYRAVVLPDCTFVEAETLDGSRSLRRKAGSCWHSALSARRRRSGRNARQRDARTGAEPPGRATQHAGHRQASVGHEWPVAVRAYRSSRTGAVCRRHTRPDDAADRDGPRRIPGQQPVAVP